MATFRLQHVVRTFFIALTLVVSFAGSGLAATITTTGTGAWSSTTPNAPWPGGIVPSATDLVIIAPGHTVTLDVNAAALNSLTINGSLITTGTFTINSTVIVINGTLTNGSTGLITGAVTVNSSGIYIHAVDNVTLPTATWNVGSMCRVTGVTGTALAGTTQSFYHFEWASANTVASNITPTAIAGNLSVTSGGSAFFRVSTTPITVANLSLSGTANMQIASGAPRVLNVAGNFSMTSGTLTMATAGGTAVMNVGGNFSHTGGTITKTGLGATSVVLNSGSTQTYTSGGTVAGAIDFTVNNNTTLQMATSTTAITGGGTFLLSAGSTLGVTSPLGITVAGAGNIQTGTRTYSAGANYVYNGGGSQATGDGLSQNSPANVTILDAGFVVSLSANTTISNALNVTAGTFNANGSTTTVNGVTNVVGIYQASTAAQTFNGGLNIPSGIFTGSTGSVTAGDVTLTAGILTAPSGGFNVFGNWNTSGGTFTPGGNTVTFTKPSSIQTLNSGGSPFSNIAHTGAGELQLVTSALTETGTFTNTAGNFNANGLSHTVNDGIVSGGNYLASSGTQTFLTSLLVSGGTFTGSSGNVVVADITISNGTLIAPSGSFNVSGNWLKSGGSFTSGSNTVSFTKSSGAQTLNSGGSSFYNVAHIGDGTLQLTGSALTTGGTFIETSGSFDANNLAHTVSGLTTLTGLNYAATSALQSFNGGLVISGETFTGASGNVSAANLTLNSGSLIAPTGTLSVSGNWAYNGGTFNNSTGTVVFNGTTQLIGGSLSTTFHHVTTSGTTNTSTGIATTINGNLSIGNGTTFTVGGFDLSVAGSTSIGGGSSGTLTLSSSAGTKILGGSVTLGSGAVWDNTGNSPVAFHGGITRSSGAFNAGTGVYTFDTNSQSLTGTYAIPNVTVSGITLTNNNDLAVSTALSGTGSFTQSSGASLTLSGSSAITTLNASNAGNTVTYDGSTQTIRPGTYHHLTVNQTAGPALLSGVTQVNGTLSLLGGNLKLGANNVTLGSASTISGGSASTMIIASGAGELRKIFSSAGSFTFPVGDDAGTVEYSPITIDASAASGFSGTAYLGVGVTNLKHPSNSSTTNFLTRYWSVRSSEISGPVNVSGTYLPADVSGTESGISPASLTGVFNKTTNPWKKGASVLSGSPLTLTNVPLSSGQSTFVTGIDGTGPVVTITNGATANICYGSTLVLVTSVTGGQPSVTYSWTPTAGLDNTTLANPTLTGYIIGTTSYVVTVTDGNGVTSTAQIDVTVDQSPTVSNAGADQNVCGSSTPLTANTAVIGTGAWSVVSGAGGSFLLNTDPATTFSGVAGTTYVLRWTITNGLVCAPSTDDVQIRLDQTPTVSNAGSDQTGATSICGTSTTLTGNTAVIGTGVWSVVSGAGGSFVDVNNATTVFNGVAGTTYTLAWTITSGVCAPSVDNVDIEFDQSPTVSNAGADQNVCGSSTALTANTAVIGTGAWSVVSGAGGSFLLNTDPATTFSGVAGTTYVLRWTITNGLVCAPSTDDVQIRLDQTPTVSNAGSDQTGATAICGTSTTLTGNTAVIGTGVWSVVSGSGGSFVDVNNATTVFNGVAGTTYTLAWTITSGVCAPSVDNVDIEFDQSPTVSNAGADQNVCGSSTALTANTAVIGTGAWSVVSGAGGSFLLNTDPATTFSGVAGTTYVLRWTITNGLVCAPSTDDVQIRLDQTPTVSNAGSDQTGATAICGTSTTLTGNTAVIGTGVWSVVSGAGGSFVDVNNATTVFNGVAGTTYTLAWTITSGVCAPSVDNVDIEFDQSPTVSNAGADQNVCGSSTPLTANTAVIGTGAWSVVSGAGGSFLLNTDPATTFSGVAGTTYVLRWTITNGLVCAPSTDDVQIRLDQTPTVSNAGSDQTGATAICGTSTTLTGNTAVIGTGVWSVVSGAGGSFVDVNNATTVFNGVAGTTYTLAWTITSGVCAPSVDNVDIEFDQSPTVSNAGADQNVCGSSTPLTANTAVIGTGAWSVVSGAGGSFLLNTDPATTFSGVAGTTYVLRWTITNGLVCAPSTDDVQIRLDQTPTVSNAGSDQTGATAICGTSTTLTGNTAVIGTGVWSVVSGSGGSFVDVNNATTVFNGVAGTTYTLAWTITSGVCAPSVDNVDIEFDQSPTVSNAGADQNVCGSSTPLTANTAVIGTGAWSVVSGAGGSFLLNTDPATTFSGVAGTTYVLRWTITNGLVCAPSTDDVQIRLDQTPTVSNAGSDQTGATAICGTSTTLTGNTAVIGTGVWSVVSGAGGSFVDVNNATTVFNGVAGTTYTLAWTITSGVCAPSVDNVDIEFDQSPTVSNAGADQNVCGSSTALTANTAVIGTGAWSVVSGAGGSFLLNTDPATTFSGVAGTTYVLRWTITNGLVCAPSTDDVQIRLDQTPTVSNAGSDQTGATAICGTSTTLTGNTAVIGTGVWSVVSGAGGSFVDVNNATTVFNGVAGTTYTLAWTITSGVCAPSVDNVDIEFDQSPTVSNAGADQNVCGSSTALTANTAVIGTGAWSVVSGAGGSFLLNTDPATTFSGVAGTTYVLRWTITNGLVCAPSTDDVQIRLDQTPTVSNAGSDQTGATAICGTSTTLTGNTAVIGTGVWSVVSGAGGSFVDVNNATTVFNGVAGTTYTLAWTITSGVCAPSVDNVDIEFDQSPTVSNAGADQNVCGSSTPLTANTAVIGTGAWSVVSGAGGSFLLNTDPATTFSGVAGTTYVLRWTITNGLVCAPSTDDVQIRLDQTPTVSNAGSDQTGATAICGTSTTLTGNTAVIGTGVWSVVSGAGGSFVDVNNATTVFNGVAGTTYTLAWTITSGVCAPSVDNVDIEFDQSPTVSNAGADQNVCGSSTPLTANTAVIGTGAWSVVSGAGGSFLLNTDPATTFSGVAGTTYVLRWTITNGLVCAPSTDDVQIRLDQTPTVSNAGSDQTGATAICGTSTTLTGNTAVIGTGVWSVVSGAGGSFVDVNNATTVFNGVAGTTYTLAWTITSGVCAPSVDNVDIEFDQSPTVSNAGADQNVCGSSTALTANTAVIGTGAWSVVSGAGGSFLLNTDPATTFSGVAGTTYVLRWTITNGLVCAPSTDDVQIRLDQTPTVSNAGSDQTGATAICGTSTMLTGNTAVIGTGVWSVVSGAGGSFVDVNNATTVFNGVAGTTYTLAWTITSGVCAPSVDNVDIEFDQSPTVSNAGADQNVCGSSTALTANTAVIGTGAWSVVSGAGGSFLLNTDPATTFSGVAGTTYVLRWTITSGVCAPSVDNVDIEFDQSPTVSNAGSDQTGATAICGTSTTLTGNTAVIGTGVWSVVSGAGGSFVDVNNATTVFNGVAGTTYTLAWTITSGVCAPSVDNVDIEFDQSPTVSNAGPDITHCNVSSFVMAGNSPVIGTGVWTYVSGFSGITITSPGSNVTTVTGLTAGNTVTLRWTITNGLVCAPSTDDVVLTNYEEPIPTAVTNVSVCPGSSINVPFTANTGGGETFTWTNTNTAIGIAASGTGNIVYVAPPNTTGVDIIGTIRVTASKNGCSTLLANQPTFTITIKATPVVSVISDVTVCAGSTVSAIPLSANTLGGETFNWSGGAAIGLANGSVSSGPFQIPSFVAINSSAIPVVTTINVTATKNSCTSAIRSFNIIVNPIPVGVPVAATTVCSDTALGTPFTLTTTGTSVSAASYTISVANGGLTQSAGTASAGPNKNANELIDDAWTNTSGSFVDVVYTVIPVSSSGCPGASFTVTARINPEPASPSNVTTTAICSDIATGYTLSVSGATTYIISTNSNGLIQSGGTVSAGTGKLPGELADDKWTNINASFASINVVYTIVPVSGSGCSGDSFTVTVPVKPEPRGANATLTQCSNTTLSYNLQVTNINGLGNGLASGFSWLAASNSNVLGETTTSQSTSIIGDNLVNTTMVDQVVIYTITPTGTVSTCAGDDFTLTVTVKPQPVGVPISATTICSDVALGTPFTLTTTSTSVSAASYTISVANGGLTQSAGIASAGTGKNANELIDDAWTNTTGSFVDVIYTVTPISSAGCSGASFTVTARINPEPAITSNVLTSLLCSDIATGYTLTVAGAATYNITTNSNGLIQSGGTVSAGTGKLPSELSDDRWNNINSAFASINVVYTIVPVSSSGCFGDTFTVTVPVKPEPRGANDVKTICSNTAVAYNLQTTNINSLGNSLTSNFQWIATNNTNVSGESLSSQSANTINNTLINITGVDQVVVYTVTPTGTNGCLGDNFTVSVTVKPQPVGANDTQVVCSDMAINYNLLLNVATLGNNVGSTFSWIATDNTNVTGESLSAQAGPIITNVVTNTTNVNQNVIYTVTPTAATGCAGNAFQITVTVKPEPVGANTAAPAICSETSVNYNLQTNVNTLGNNLAATFSWKAISFPNITGASATVKTGAIINDILVNTTNSDQSAIYEVTPTSSVGGCVGNIFTITVTVNPKAVFSAGPDLSVCVSSPSKQLSGSAPFAPGGIIWNGGTNNFDNEFSPTPTYTLSASELATTSPLTITFTMTALGAGACTSVADQMILTINPLPVVGFVGLPPSVSENTPSMTLSGNSLSGVGGQFTITPALGLSPTTINGSFDVVTFDPSSAKVYDLTPASLNHVTYTYTNPATSCINSTTQTVRVNPITNIDFTIESRVNPILNASGAFEFCANQGLVKLIGNPVASSGQPPETQFIGVAAYPGGPIAPISKIGNDYFIDTNGLRSDTYGIEYDYKNTFGAITNTTRNIKLFAAPVPAFTSTNNCIASDVVFTDGSVVGTTPFAATIVNYQWDFGDGTASVKTVPNSTKRYATSGTYNVTLKTTTTQGCSATTAPVLLRVGDVPIVDFDWSAICNNDKTKFEDVSNPGTVSTITSYKWDFGDGDILTGAKGAAVPAGTNGGRSSGTFEKPDHKYNSAGVYTAKLTVLTNDGCNNTQQDKISILPSYTTLTPVAASAYVENFEGSDGGWIREAKAPSDTSWTWGTPKGAVINSASSGTKAWWTGLNNNAYFPTEKSVVNGPCFNLTQLSRPMIAVDYWVNAERNLDGAVLQYSTDGGLHWQIVGSIDPLNQDQGINWYTGIGIPSNPGDQTTGGNFGWTGVDQKSWLTGKFNLDMIPVANRSQVRLRVAFASNDSNLSGLIFDGFAFDNVFVGEKTRNVVVEHFTNSADPGSRVGDQWLSDRYQEQLNIAPGRTSDFHDIQYHISYLKADPLNLDNEADPSARANYLGVSQPPSTIMDGNNIDGVKFKGSFTEITKVEIDRRSLVDPLFELKLDTIPTGAKNTISVQLTMKANKAFDSPLIAQVALIENSVGAFKNVLRKQLLGPDGEAVNLSWSKDQTRTITKSNITINVPIVTSSQLTLIAYVQDKNKKEIYQSVVIAGPKKTGAIVTAIEEDPATPTTLNGIKVYPNPASGYFNFGLENYSSPGYSWKVADQRGVVLLKGDFEGAVENRKQVDVSSLSNGVYFVIISGPGRSTVYQKLIVLNRN